MANREGREEIKVTGIPEPIIARQEVVIVSSQAPFARPR